MTNKHGMTVQVITFGARVVSLAVQDRHDKIADVILGCDNIAGQICGFIKFKSTDMYIFSL